MIRRVAFERRTIVRVCLIGIFWVTILSGTGSASGQSVEVEGNMSIVVQGDTKALTGHIPLSGSYTSASSQQKPTYSLGTDFHPTELTIEPNSLPVGESAQIQATVVNRGATGSDQISIHVGDLVVYDSRYRIHTGDGVDVTTTVTVNESGEYPVTIQGTEKGVLTVQSGTAARSFPLIQAKYPDPAYNNITVPHFPQEPSEDQTNQWNLGTRIFFLSILIGLMVAGGAVYVRRGTPRRR